MESDSLGRDPVPLQARSVIEQRTTQGKPNRDNNTQELEKRGFEKLQENSNRMRS